MPGGTDRRVAGNEVGAVRVLVRTATAMIRVALTGTGATTVATSLAGDVTVVAIRPPAALLASDGAGADVVLLRSVAPARDLRMLCASPKLPPMLVVAGRAEPADLSAALAAGAASLLIEGQFDRAGLLDALHATAAGHSRLSPDAVTALVRELRAPSPAPPSRALSARELEVMDLLAAGASNAQIAEQLMLAEKTVRNVVSRIYRKLRVRNRSEAAVLWLGQH